MEANKMLNIKYISIVYDGYLLVLQDGYHRTFLLLLQIGIHKR